MNIGIAGFGYYLPEKEVPVKELGQKAGLPDAVINYIGAKTVREAENNKLP